jgi:polyphosphate kinase 2 (PPK2 family)
VDWDHWHLYDNFIAAAERTIMRTSSADAQWHIVEGLDKRYRSLSVATTILEGVRKHLKKTMLHRQMTKALQDEAEVGAISGLAGDSGGNGDDKVGGGAAIPLSRVTILNRLDMSLSLDKKSYRKELEKYQGKLNQAQRQARDLGISTVLVFEGWDAAGKGGAIRRVTAALDARDYQVIPIAAPTDEERAQHYLWRFWRHLSRAGRVTVFDRSWYGRVLVERVEGFASESEWKRAYAEIDDFEDQLVRHGIVLCKFWVHITKEEQLDRFKAREGVLYKRWKLTDEDWRNRERWEDYEIAVNDMVERTSTTLAPWTLVEGNDKRYARIKVISTVCERLIAGIQRSQRDAGEPAGGKNLKRTG